MIRVHKEFRVEVRCARKDCGAADQQTAADRFEAIKELRRRGWQIGQRVWCGQHSRAAAVRRDAAGRDADRREAKDGSH